MNKLTENYNKWYDTEKVAVIHKSQFKEDPIGEPYVVAFVWVNKFLTTEQKLEKAYMLTNSIDDAWWKNKEVEALHKTRSTSAGDQVEINGVKYVCEITGWRKIND